VSGRGILDADMATLGRYLAQGWRWWLDELAALVPARLRRGGGEALPRMVLADAQLAPAPGERRVPTGAVAVVVPRAACLVRTTEWPTLGERDVQRLVALEADRLFPAPPGEMLVAARRMEGGAPGRTLVEVAALPRAHATHIADAAAAAQLTPARVLLEGADAIDFAPALRAEGLIARPRSGARFWWSIVAFLALFNVALAVWRDAARVERLERLVAEQQPALNVARTIATRVARDRRVALQSAVLRRRQDALATLAAAGAALPSGAWVQRYVWEPPELRLTGYRPPRSDVATALRRAGFAQVHAMGESGDSATPLGEPFDLSAQGGGR
jgi:hypothetical protein